MNASVAAGPQTFPAGGRRLLIGGQWQAAREGRSFTSIDPSTGLALAEVADADAGDVDAAVAAARCAFTGEWASFKPYDRQRLIQRFADLVERNFDELAQLDSRDMGSPISRSTLGKRRIVGMLHYYAAQAVTLQGDVISNSLAGHVMSFVQREPVGVVGAITPWNGPLTSAMWKLGPVLATGCTMVLKPSEFAPLSALRLGELLVEAGLPPGVVNIITGYGETTGAALAAHPGVDKVAFTGSPEVGRKIVAASAGNLKRLTLELGGKSPDIVFADANLDAAVQGAAMAIFGNSGQVCSAGSRLYVESSIHDAFMERLATFARSLKVGPAMDMATQMGPLVSQRQLDRVQGFIDSGRAEGASLLTGGERLSGGDAANGFFMPPTIFADVHDGMGIARQEIFGPVLAAMRFDSVDDVVRRANDTPYGLGCGIWTRDVGKAHRIAGAIRAGSVWVNCYHAMDPAVPFGGYGQSGYGRESGRQQLDDYLQAKAVWINAT